MALLGRSPALDKGDDGDASKLKFDARGPGFARSEHGHVDAGAADQGEPGPVTSTRAEGRSRSASRVAAACAELTTCSTLVGAPRAEMCSATALGGREALFVTYTTARPERRTASRASGAPSIACGRNFHIWDDRPT